MSLSSLAKRVAFIGATTLFAFPFCFFLAVLQSDESLLSAALSMLCSFPFSSSVA